MFLRRSPFRICVAAALLAGATLVPRAAATAQQTDGQQSDEPRGYCAARPGMGTTPCTISPGRVSVEVAAADWERSAEPGLRTDSLLFGDLAVRVGITDTIELLAQATPYGRLTTRQAGTPRTTEHGSGDVMLGAKVNLLNPDGSGFSIAALPFGTLPVGSTAFGAGDWSVGLLVPMSYAASDTVSLQLTPEFDFVADSDGVGRHPAYSLIAGVGVGVADGISITHELAIGRDLDPADTSTQTLYSTSLAWMPTDDLQFDAGTVLGLNSVAPDARFYVGIARRF